MAPSGSIGDREREILTAIVETFIATGEPVGSRSLSRSNREGLSPATIRNVMADLSDAGYLDQPHTSAGRIPTTEAYRYYVEQISGEAMRAYENLAAQGERSVKVIGRQVEEQPVVSLLLAFAVGFLGSRMLSR